MSEFRLNIIVVLVVAIITIAFAFGVMFPGFREYDRRAAEVAVLADRVEEEQRRIGSVGETYSAIMELERAMRGFRERVPGERRFGEFLSTLSECLKSAGVDDYVVKPGPARRIDANRLPADLEQIRGATILPVQVAFAGRLATCFDFVRHIESLTRTAVVESMTLRADLAESPELSMDVVIHTYFKPEELGPPLQSEVADG